MDEYYQAIHFLPAPIFELLRQLPLQAAGNVHEIRLRSDRPIMLCSGTRSFAVPGENRVLTHAELLECYYALCGYSVHAYEQELCQGYFTLAGGHRVGVAGLPVYRNGEIASYRTLYSLNLRIARRRTVVLPPELLAFLKRSDQSLLLLGAPGSGKTTLLRGIAGCLSSLGRKTCIVDSRSEIYPGTADGYLAAPPQNCDVLEGYQKSDGIMIALRTMGAQYILCDEIGAEPDVNAILQGLCTGVCFVATMHGTDLDSARQRPQFQRLAASGAFGAVAILKSADAPGQVQEVCCL